MTMTMNDHALTFDAQGEAEEKRQARIENIAGTIAIRYSKAQAAQIIDAHIFTTGGDDVLGMMACIAISWKRDKGEREADFAALKAKLGEIIDAAAEAQAAVIVDSGEAHDCEDDE
jgi:anaerobic C4-dicarboxylate transporter